MCLNEAAYKIVFALYYMNGSMTSVEKGLIYDVSCIMLYGYDYVQFS